MNKLKTSNYTTINLFFSFFPISMMLGTLIVNLNILIFFLLTLFISKEKFFNYKFNLIDKLIFFFFCYIFFVLFMNFFDLYLNNKILSKTIILKTIFYLRFLFLFFSLRFLIEKKILNINWFMLSAAISASFISFDILIQYFFGKNLFGIKPFSTHHFSSIFKDELIAGSYLQKFSLFILFIPFLKNFFLKNIYFKIFLILLISFCILLSGNRMPLILFVFSIFIYFLFNERLKKMLLSVLLFITVFLLVAINLNQNFKENFERFYYNTADIFNIILFQDLTKQPMHIWKKPYITEFQCGKEAIKSNPVFGGGIRSFRINFVNCSSHPHNYYLEIWADLGFLGLFIFTSISWLIIKNLYFNNIYLKKLKNNIWPFFLIICAEVFPLKSSGSFFTTKNSLIIFMSFAILASLYKENKININYHKINK